MLWKDKRKKIDRYLLIMNVKFFFCFRAWYFGSENHHVIQKKQEINEQKIGDIFFSKIHS